MDKYVVYDLTSHAQTKEKSLPIPINEKIPNYYDENYDDNDYDDDDDDDNRNF